MSPPLQTERSAQLQKFQLSDADFAKLAQHASDQQVLFISTPFDLTSAAVLEPLVDAFKIASSDNTFLPLLERVARTDKPMILSTGLTTLCDLQETVARLEPFRAGKDLALMHCVTSYPGPPGKANTRACVDFVLRALETLTQSGKLPSIQQKTT